MTKEQSKAHWWIVENHPNFRITPPKKYFEICDIVFSALNQGQQLPIDSVSKCCNAMCDNPVHKEGSVYCGECKDL